MIKVAVLLPCYNEETAIEQVVKDFCRALPDAEIYVYDNNSTDSTAAIASAAGAIVRQETLQGKGNVIRRMFADVDADVYVIADGDGTYTASDAPVMIERLLKHKLDMVVGTRLNSEGQDLFRGGHRFGNLLITQAVSLLFGKRFSDILSGYRVMTRRFVKSFPGLTSGFEIETELSIHALQLKLPVDEVPSVYRVRPRGSHSKLNTYRDGARIARIILYFLKEIKPFIFFSVLASFLALISLILAYPIFTTWLETGLVPRFPTAILSTGIMLLSFLCFFCGLILESLSAARWEAKRSRYLEVPLSDVNTPEF